MEVKCAKYETVYLVDEVLGGRKGQCDECEQTFMLPIRDPQKLLDRVHDFFNLMTAGVCASIWCLWEIDIAF